MIIGIDFDNTIINYGHLFNLAAEPFGIKDKSYSKQEVKRVLVDRDGNDKNWQMIQKEVYASLIENAQMFPGVYEFIRAMLEQGHQVFVVSHKTKVSNLDGRTNLIQPALNWMTKQKLIGPQGLLLDSQFFFCQTQDEKINRIKSLKCDVFIDDLPAVLTHPEFPQSTLKILFSKSDSRENTLSSFSWYQIFQLMDVRNTIGDSILLEIYHYFHQLAVKVSICSDSGNHASYRLELDNEDVFFLKKTKKPERRKLLNEYQALKLLNENKVCNVPRAIYLSANSDFIIQEWIAGKKVAPISQHHLLKVIAFLQRLDALNQYEIEYSNASMARTKLQDYMDAIELRIGEIYSGISTMSEQYPKLNLIKDLMDDKIVPVQKQLFNRFLSQIERLNLDSEKVFEKEQWILSPSDFAFNNMLETADGELVFIDFEYFGWDDKVKLVADFLNHLGHSLSDEQYLFFLRQLQDTGFLDENCLQRYELVKDLIRLEWVLIALNVASEKKLQQKIDAYQLQEPQSFITQRYEKAKYLMADF